MKGHGQKLSQNQEKAIAALLASPSIPAAAKVVGIGQSTLCRWLKLDGFKDAYLNAKKEVVCQAVGKVQSAMTEAVCTLQTVMADLEAPASARVAAARAILDLGLRAFEMEEFEQRLKILENKFRG